MNLPLITFVERVGDFPTDRISVDDVGDENQNKSGRSKCNSYFFSENEIDGKNKTKQVSSVLLQYFLS